MWQLKPEIILSLTNYDRQSRNSNVKYGVFDDDDGDLAYIIQGVWWTKITTNDRKQQYSHQNRKQLYLWK